MSLSLSLGKATPQDAAHVELPATASRLPDDPSQFRRDPSDARPNSQSGSQQRATAATRSRRTATNPDSLPAVAPVSSHTPSKFIIPATPSLPPSAAAAGAAVSASATVAGPTHTLVDDAIDLTTTKGRSSRKKSTFAAQATSSAAAALAADLLPPIPLPVDDHSTSFFTDFKLALNENLNGAFHLFGHIDGEGKELLCLLLQKSPAIRIYRFQGRLSSLRPEALSSRGMHGKEYRIHVENGLRTQDSTSYEHEFSVNEMGLSETEGAPLIQAELKLFKQMGTSATVRIPVCLAHIRFEPMTLIKSSPKPIEQMDQDDGEFKTKTVELIHALNEWSAQIGTRTSAQKIVEKQLVAQISIASSLLPPKSATGSDLIDDASDLMKHMLRVLNESKVAIRAQRERKQFLEVQKNNLHKKLYPSKEEEEDYDSESDQSVLSESEDEHEADDGVHHMEVDEEKKYDEPQEYSRPALTSATSIPAAIPSARAAAASSSSRAASAFAEPRPVSPVRRGRSRQPSAPNSATSNLVAAPSSAAPSALPPASNSTPSQFVGMPPSLSFPNSIDPVSAHATPFSPSQFPGGAAAAAAGSFIPSPPNSGSGRSQRAVSNLARTNANSFSNSGLTSSPSSTSMDPPPPRAPITNVRKRARVIQPTMPPPPAVSKPDAFSASLNLMTGTNSRSTPSRRASNDLMGAAAGAATSARDQQPASLNKPMTNVSQLLREVGNSPHSRRQPHDTASGLAQPSAPQPSKRQKR